MFMPGEPRGLEKTSAPLGLELQTIVSYPVITFWVLTSGRAASALNP